MGRKGGSAKVPKGYAMLSPEERSERSTAAIKKRWKMYYAAKKAEAKAATPAVKKAKKKAAK